RGVTGPRIEPEDVGGIRGKVRRRAAFIGRRIGAGEGDSALRVRRCRAGQNHGDVDEVDPDLRAIAVEKARVLRAGIHGGVAGTGAGDLKRAGRRVVGPCEREAERGFRVAGRGWRGDYRLDLNLRRIVRMAGIGDDLQYADVVEEARIHVVAQDGAAQK